MRTLAGLLAGLAIAGGCGRLRDDGPSPAPKDSPPAAEGNDVVRRTTRVGPVTAIVTLSPSKPRIGDSLTLALEVSAEPGVDVRLPAFGEALGRFEIVDFTPRRRVLPDSRTEQSQRYTLDTPMSGRQTIPPLRVEFEDRRSGASEGPRELLTERISLDVESALEEDASAGELRPPRGALAELADPAKPHRRWAYLAGGACVAAILLAFVIARWRRRRRRETAFDVAMARLSALETRGLPRPGEADAWYVELSSIVRRYLEDQFGLRAPSRTTEEFLREAGASAVLAEGHRGLLKGFLQQCDCVKFSAHQPREAESREALDAARRFIEESLPAPGQEAVRA